MLLFCKRWKPLRMVHHRLPLNINLGWALRLPSFQVCSAPVLILVWKPVKPWQMRSEEHTSELQSRRDLVCRLLLEKKKNIVVKQDIKIKKKTIYSYFALIYLF